jgi:hypothetical protein
MSKSCLKGVLLFALLAVAGRLAVSLYAPDYLDRLQLAVFVLTIGLLLVARVRFLSFPTLLLAGLGGTIGAAFGYSVLSGSDDRLPRVYVTRLSGDPTGGQSRIIREAIESRNGSLARRFHRELDLNRQKREQLRQFFDRAKGESAIVWGTTGLIRYSALPKVAQRLKSLPQASAPSGGGGGAQPLVSRKLGELLLIPDVPVIGLSFQPIGATGEFIAGLTRAQRLSGLERDLELEATGRLAAGWRSAEHRAYPFFLLSTELVRRYFLEGAREPGLLLCAQRDLQTALTFLVTGGNTELLAAVRNNAGVVRALIIESEGGNVALAAEHLRLAKRAGARSDPFGLEGDAARFAAENLRILLGQVEKKGKAKGKSAAHKKRQAKAD